MLAALLAASAAAAELVPIRYLVLTTVEGEAVGEMLTADRFETDDEPGVVYGLLETAEGETSLVSYSLDTGSGVTTERLVDMTSGWWAELTIDRGYSNMGDVDDYADSWDWIVAQRERRERLQTPTSYQVATGDGVGVQWTEPWKDEEAGDEARGAALAELAAAMLERTPPPSTYSAVRIHARLAESGASGETEIAKRLTRLLAETFHALDGEWKTAPAVEIEHAEPDERARGLGRALERAAEDG